MQQDYVPEKYNFYQDDKNKGPHDSSQMMPLAQGTSYVS
jgi:hypothetical protein